MNAIAGAASADALFARPRVVAEHRADGSVWLRSAEKLEPYARCVGDWLEQWAGQAPDRAFLGERSAPDAPWFTVSYRQALRQARAVGSWMLAQGMSAERPLVILSDNSVEHALLT